MPDLSAVEMSLRESARRFIRIEACTIHHPHLYRSQVGAIIEAFSEFLPARLKLPIHNECDDDKFSIFDEKNVLIAQVGGFAPELSASWTSGNTDSLFIEFSQQVAELLAVDIFHEGDKELHEYLSDREFQVMVLVASGKSIVEISKELSLSDKTISTYRTRILAKMGMHSNAEIIYYSIDHKLIN